MQAAELYRKVGAMSEFAVLDALNGRAAGCGYAWRTLSALGAGSAGRLGQILTRIFMFHGGLQLNTAHRILADDRTRRICRFSCRRR